MIPTITPTENPALAKALDDCINQKTKPPGSLGQLERLGHQIGMIQASTRPALYAPAIIVFAGDHGVAAENISAFPQEVTWQMVENFLAQGAAINVFARQNGMALHIVDAGVKHDFGPREGLLDRKVAFGTQNFALQPAMSQQQCQQAMVHGMALAWPLLQAAVNFMNQMATFASAEVSNQDR